jgi:hypothetical protein
MCFELGSPKQTDRHNRQRRQREGARLRCRVAYEANRVLVRVREEADDLALGHETARQHVDALQEPNHTAEHQDRADDVQSDSHVAQEPLRPIRPRTPRTRPARG